MRVGFDLDGTIDSDPKVFGDLMRSLRRAGHEVLVLTGSGQPHVDTDEVAKKVQRLKQLGVGDAYDRLVVFAETNIAKAKAAYCKKKSIALLIDNNVENAQLASHHCTVLVPWNTRQS